MTEILFVCFFLLLGTACLYYGAEWLVDGSSQLALSMGLTPLAVGLTVVAFGTSMPELAVSLKAGLSGSSDLAVGNVIGSNISNIALILGICSLFRPIVVHVQVVRIDTPLMILISILVGILILSGPIMAVSGSVLLLGIIAYTAFNYITARRSTQPELEESQPLNRSILQDLGLIVGGLLVLIVGGESFVRGATTAAQMLGISETVIGLSLVAIGTSLPELATALVATRKGESDLVIGNVVGSNVFNLLCILGITALVVPIDTSGVHPADIIMMIGTSLALMPILWSGHRIERKEGAILLLLYVGYIGWLYAAR
jgi:cation:H+ antiporter